MNKKTNILHIVPTIYGGGVETAAKSFLNTHVINLILKYFF